MKVILKGAVSNGSMPATQITVSCHSSAKPNRVMGFVVIITNFTPVPWDGYRVGVPEPGYYKEILNTDSENYWGSNIGNDGGQATNSIPMHGHPQSLSLILPPLATIMLRLES